LIPIGRLLPLRSNRRSPLRSA